MAVNLSALSNFTTTAQALSNVILVNPQKNAGIQAQPKVLPDGSTSSTQDPAFIFDYEGENSIDLETDITDHWVEDNSARQDQMALKPEQISTQGYVGELNDVVPELLQPLKTIADKLTVIDGYLPRLSITALLAYNQAAQAYATASLVGEAAVSAWNTITNGEETQTKEAAAFLLFYGYWQNRTLFTVQTPWAIFSDMAIKSLRPVQDETTRMVTQFSITFKKMRFAKFTSSAEVQFGQGRFNAMSSSQVDNGFQAPKSGPSQSSQLNSFFTGSF